MKILLISVLTIAALLSCNQQSKTKETKTVITNSGIPEFPGGDNALQKYIRKNLKWTEPKEDTIDGNLFISFIVRKNGEITDVEVSKGICKSCDEAAVNLVKGMPKWIPAQKNGENVDQNYTLRIYFESDYVKHFGETVK